MQPRPFLVADIRDEVSFRLRHLLPQMRLLQLVSGIDPTHPDRFGIRLEPRKGSVFQDLWRQHPLYDPGVAIPTEVELGRRSVKIRCHCLHS